MLMETTSFIAKNAIQIWINKRVKNRGKFLKQDLDKNSIEVPYFEVNLSLSQALFRNDGYW